MFGSADISGYSPLELLYEIDTLHIREFTFLLLGQFKVG
jgi:hypothetical protein